MTARASIYGGAARAAIAELLGPCQSKRSQAQALSEIEQAAQTLREDQAREKNHDKATQKARREQLCKVEAAALRLHALVSEIEPGADLYLNKAARALGSTIEPERIKELAAAAKLAATDAGNEIKPGDDPEPLFHFVYALSVIYHEASGRNAGITEDRNYSYAPFSGDFFDFVTVCLEQLGINLRNRTLGPLIRRVITARSCGR